MLQNAYFLAKIGADTAENEQHFAEILPIDHETVGRTVSGQFLHHRVACELLQDAPSVLLRDDDGEVGLTWGICTRRAGKLYKARSRLYRCKQASKYVQSFLLFSRKEKRPRYPRATEVHLT